MGAVRPPLYRVISRLAHPNVVTLIEIDKHQGLARLVSKWLSVQPIRAMIGATGGLSLKRGVYMVAQLLNGIAHAHDQGDGHLDLKPGKVMNGECAVMKQLNRWLHWSAAALPASNTARTSSAPAPGVLAQKTRAGETQSQAFITASTGTICPDRADSEIASVVANVMTPPRPDKTGAAVPRMTSAKFCICA